MVTAAIKIPAHVGGDIAVLPNGDLVWPYVDMDPTYTPTNRSVTAKTETLAFARPRLTA